MRRILLCSLAALALAACNRDTTGPAAMDDLFAFTSADFGAVAYGMMPGMHPGAGLPELRRLKAFPDSLKLTAEQEAKISDLLESFQSANQADLEALKVVMDRAKAARDAGKGREEVRAILQEALPIHLRLMAASLKLRADTAAVLTAEQRAWLLSRMPQPCNPGTVAPLTDAQKTQIKALNDAFRAATQADHDAVKAALEQARTAKQAGATPEQVRAIMDGVKDPMARLQAAGDKLRTDIDAVLTPEQKASHCFRMGPQPMGGRHR